MSHTAKELEQGNEGVGGEGVQRKWRREWETRGELTPPPSPSPEEGPPPPSPRGERARARGEPPRSPSGEARVGGAAATTIAGGRREFRRRCRPRRRGGRREQELARRRRRHHCRGGEGASSKGSRRGRRQGRQEWEAPPPPPSLGGGESCEEAALGSAWPSTAPLALARRPRLARLGHPQLPCCSRRGRAWLSLAIDSCPAAHEEAALGSAWSTTAALPIPWLWCRRREA